MTRLKLVPPRDEAAAPGTPTGQGAADPLSPAELCGYSKRVPAAAPADPADLIGEIRRLVQLPGEDALDELQVALFLDRDRLVPVLRRIASIGELARSLSLRLEGRTR